jgi:pyridoxal phosphate enzyme (YggS family)
VSLVDRLAVVQHRIDAVSGGRPVQIIGVTKGFSGDAVTEAMAAGLTDLGENYAQELVAKAAVAPAARWHFIGTIQRNKVAALAPLVTLWHTVDRVSVIDAISRHAPGAGVLVQVNLAGAANRGGCRWDEVDSIVATARQRGLDVRGLMGVGPAGPPADSRQPFVALARCARRLGLTDLSMGMSDDLEVAIEEGSTMVRIGTAIFGPRVARF